jgi:hypothetical protein
MDSNISQRVDKVKEKIQERDGIITEFTGDGFTVFGGMRLFGKFIKKIKIQTALEDFVDMPRRENKYSAGEYFICFIYAFVLGLTRLSDTVMLQADKVFQRIVGLKDYPHQTSLSRFLWIFTVPLARKIGEVNIHLLTSVRESFRGMSKITLDIDSHVRTVYGNQQRAKRGYNPKKPGRKSYHPLLCFIGETRDFLWGRFRSGNCHTSKGVIKFLRECLGFIPLGIKTIFIRADSGFYSTDFLAGMEKKRSRNIRYAVAVKLYPWIQKHLVGIVYHEIGNGYETGEFRYKSPLKKDDKERRMIVIREKIRKGKKKKKELSLFELTGYNYQVIVTNIESWVPEEVWHFYNGRANVENMIKEGVMEYGLEVTPAHYYGANAAHFFIVMLAYNVMNWYKEFVLGLEKIKRMAKWIRQRFLIIGGKLVKSGRRWTLKLWRDYPWKEKYRQGEERLQALQFCL